MVSIAINDIKVSESFLTEFNYTDLAMNQIHGGMNDCPDTTTTTTTPTTTTPTTTTPTTSTVVVAPPRRRRLFGAFLLGAVLESRFNFII
ncbi:hypothetical protein [Moorena sp. SIO3H5]|uniref:hypothetical protein n=1 Tax=Moorena sp. SIO3H5 TaxID=2607834 RepID=UPI0013BD798E|nr:hypothetical protein [Moorena sp. SIO3H5]NEO70664.1 hypothetical protein [Moorena sp. SIO3H5]